MTDLIGPNEAALVSFGLVQHLLKLLVKNGTISANEMADLLDEVRKGMPANDKYKEMDGLLANLSEKARSVPS